MLLRLHRNGDYISGRTNLISIRLKLDTRAIEGAQGTLASVMFKARFWERHATQPLNERQIKVLNRLLDGFEGKLTTSKWAKLTKCSQDTAHRDILDLMKLEILVKSPEGGRSTSYNLADI